VKHKAPRSERLVRGEQHRPAMQVALVDDLEHEVGGVAADGQVAHFIDHENGRMRVARECRGKLPVSKRSTQLQLSSPASIVGSQIRNSSPGVSTPL
jgi:hypothetical protein